MPRRNGFESRWGRERRLPATGYSSGGVVDGGSRVDTEQPDCSTAAWGSAVERLLYGRIFQTIAGHPISALGVVVGVAILLGVEIPEGGALPEQCSSKQNGATDGVG